MENQNLVTLPEDEVNVVKAEDVQQAIDNLADADKKTAYAMGLADGALHAETLTGKAEVGKLYGTGMDDVITQSEPESVDPISTLTEDQTMAPKEVLAKSMTIVKELCDNPEIQAALQGKGLTVDVKKLLSDWQAVTGFETTNAIIRPMTEEEKIQAEGKCACDDCLEETESEVDTDTMLIVHDLSVRLAALEKRIEEYNVRSSHKI